MDDKRICLPYRTVHDIDDWIVGWEAHRAGEAMAIDADEQWAAGWLDRRRILRDMEEAKS